MPSLPPHFYHTSLLNLTDCRYVKGEDSYSTLRGGRKEEKEKQAPHTTKTFKKSIVNTYLIQLQFGCFFILWTDWQDDITTKICAAAFVWKKNIVFNIGINHWCSHQVSRFLFLQIFSYFLISDSVFAPLHYHQTEEFPCARPPQCNTCVSSRTLKWAAVWCWCPLGLLISD